MACTTCAARAARRQGRYLSPQTYRFQAEPLVEEEAEIICTYEKEQLEIKHDELTQLVKIEPSFTKRKKLYLDIAILRIAIREYDNNCLKYVTKVYEILGI